MLSSQIFSVNFWPLSHHLQCTGCKTCEVNINSILMFFFKYFQCFIFYPNSCSVDYVAILHISTQYTQKQTHLICAAPCNPHLIFQLGSMNDTWPDKSLLKIQHKIQLGSLNTIFFSLPLILEVHTSTIHHWDIVRYFD